MKIMKYMLLSLSLLIIAGCSNQSGNTKNDAENPAKTDLPQAEEVLEEVELSPEESQIMSNLKGAYFTLSKRGNSLTYVEECSFSEGDIRISKKLDEMDFWEIYWRGSSYDVQKVNIENRVVRIKAYSNEITTFTLSKKDTEFAQNMSVSGSTELISITRVEDVKNFNSEPCTEIIQIMDGLPQSFYELTDLDGKQVFYEPCEDAPGGITMDGETIGFWSGTDPYPIITMSKLFNKIRIVYEANGQQTALVMTLRNSTVFQFGKGNDDDTFYVQEDSKDQYETIQEEC